MKEPLRIFSLVNGENFYLGPRLLCASIHSFLVQIVESDKTRVLDCSHSVEDTERQKLDEDGVKNKSKKMAGCSPTLMSEEMICLRFLVLYWIQLQSLF